MPFSPYEYKRNLPIVLLVDQTNPEIEHVNEMTRDVIACLQDNEELFEQYNICLAIVMLSGKPRLLTHGYIMLQHAFWKNIEHIDEDIDWEKTAELVDFLFYTRPKHMGCFFPCYIWILGDAHRISEKVISSDSYWHSEWFYRNAAKVAFFADGQVGKENVHILNYLPLVGSFEGLCEYSEIDKLLSYIRAICYDDDRTPNPEVDKWLIQLPNNKKRIYELEDTNVYLCEISQCQPQNIYKKVLIFHFQDNTLYVSNVSGEPVYIQMQLFSNEAVCTKYVSNDLLMVSGEDIVFGFDKDENKIEIYNSKSKAVVCIPVHEDAVKIRGNARVNFPDSIGMEEVYI